MRESIFDGAIEIKVIPHVKQRYDTAGDWWTDSEGWHIRVSQLGDWRYNFLIAFHELIECAWCAWRGVNQADVDAFDMAFEENRVIGDLSEPGDDPRAPYHDGHQFATAAERLAALALGVRWAEYDAAIWALDYGGKAGLMAHIEFHPENGQCPHVVIAENLIWGSKLWFAYRTEKQAQDKLASIEGEIRRRDGIVEFTDAEITRI